MLKDMQQIEIKDLLEAGVHFGHQRKKWNPKMKQYIFCDKNGICIIDLSKTSEVLDNACNFLREAASQKKNIVFVCTKKHISEVIKEEAVRCGAFYINRRWLGGLLTNFDTIRQRLNRLRELEEMQESGTIEKLNKKELSVFNKELEKLQKTLGGIKTMRGKIDILFVIDQQEEEIAIKEAQKMGLKIVALVDSNCDPDGIDYPIPGNDDSIKSVKLIARTLSDAVLEGQANALSVTAKNSTGNKYSNIKPPTRLIQEVTVTASEQVTELVAEGEN